MKDMSSIADTIGCAVSLEFSRLGGSTVCRDSTQPAKGPSTTIDGVGAGPRLSQAYLLT
jgi:hypothetical protein